ncbi:MAG: hypothetical protein KA715_12415 [Xanthomonadaceae bacterium]|nr:hypothetical protein [Xanthomonadaceae bacterium]
MSEENAREIEEAEKHAPPGYKLIMLMDVSTSGVGLPDQRIPNVITKPANIIAGEYYRYLQTVGQKYSVAEVEERRQSFNDIMMNGWTEIKKDGTNI